MNSVVKDWDGHLVKLTWFPRLKLETSKVTSVHGICIKNGLVMLVHIKGRGFDFPGGHVEKGENIEDALKRELYEEGYVEGSLTYLGAIEVSHENNPLFDPKGKYPLIGYQAFYKVEVTHCFPFQRQYESATRIWVEHEEVSYVRGDDQFYTMILEEARR